MSLVNINAMGLYLISFLFVLAGLMHFITPKSYKKIMPPYLPVHYFLIYFSGFLEILFGVLLLFPQTKTLAIYGLVLLLLAVFPANIYMAQRMQEKKHKYSWIAWLRLPLQLVLIWWVVMYL